MASSQVTVCLLLAFFASSLISSSVARNFDVGGKDGWVPNPKEDYNVWAGRNRFQVNDTLTFKTKQGSDSVLVVKKDDYYNCNTQNPIKNLGSSTPVFQFDRSGPFFFISGNKENCQKGQRLTVVVLAIRSTIPVKPSPPLPPQPPSSAPKSPSPVSHPPSISPKSAPSPISQPPKSPSPVSPTISPVSKPPSLAPESPSPVSPFLPPASHPPAMGPTPAISPVSPTLAPSPEGKTPSLSPTTNAPSPANSITPGSGPAASPGTNQTADVNAPAPNRNSASWTSIPSDIIIFAVSVAIMGLVNY